MARKYQNLILGRGTYESSAVTELLVGGEFEDGFDTPREALEHFQETLMVLVKGLATQEESEGVCAHCERRNHTPYDRFCGFCGRKLKNPERDLGAEASARFAGWFCLDTHELVDWEELAGCGWNIGWLSKGGFVRLDGFEGWLENWDPEGWEDHLGRKTADGAPWTWWDCILDSVTTGEIALDGDDDSKP